MEKKRDKNNNVKKIDINGKVKVIYCQPSNKRVDYVRANGRYMKLVDYKKMQKKSKKYRGGGSEYGYQDDGHTMTHSEFYTTVQRLVKNNNYEKAYIDVAEHFKSAYPTYTPPPYNINDYITT